MALEADALHLKTDVYTSLGVAAGILLMKLTGLFILDSIVAILVALLIIKEAWELSKNAFDYLMDVRLSDEEEENIEKVIGEHSHQFIDYHKLKTNPILLYISRIGFLQFPIPLVLLFLIYYRKLTKYKKVFLLD